MFIYYIFIPFILSTILITLAKKDILFSVLFIYISHVFLKFILFKLQPDIAFASGTYINISIVLFFLLYVTQNIDIINNKNLHIFSYMLYYSFLYLIMISIINGYGFLDYIYHVRNYFFNFLLFILFLYSKKYRSAYFYIKYILVILLIQTSISVLQYKFPSVAQFFTVTKYMRFGEK